MGALFDAIKKAIAEERYVIGSHAANQLDDRGIPEWQVLAGVPLGRLMLERPADVPHPAAEIRQMLPDGTEVKAVWSYLRFSGYAKLVTVHFFDR